MGALMLGSATSAAGRMPPKIQLSYGRDPLQIADLRLPDKAGPHPVVLVLHGGFWKSAYGLDLMDGLCSALAAQGLASWNIEYRRVGDAGGGWPGTFLDVAGAADHLRSIAKEHRLDLTRVVTLGHSAGGHLALWLAARSRIPKSSPLFSATPLPIAAAVSLGGVPDLARAEALRLGGGAVRKLIGGGPKDFPDRYAAGSPAELLPMGVRQVLVHGAADDVVPLELSEAHAMAAKKAGDSARLFTLVDVGHFEPIDPHTRAWPTVERAVTEAVG